MPFYPSTHYQLACDFFRVTPVEIIFISANRWDVMGAQAFGFRTVWVNRTGAPDEYGDASRTVTSLGELAGIDWTSVPDR